jgi:putative SOS response-associated peptidase YedK
MMTWGQIVTGLRILSSIGDPPALQPRYNVRPGEPSGALVVRAKGRQISAELLKWGFRAEAKKPFAPINAKAETLFVKWPWKHSAVHRRCLVPMDGFFEPKGPKSQTNRPQYFFRFSDSRPFFVAGLWTTKVEGADLDSFALVTIEPNEQVAPIHDRMPAIVEPEAHELWLSDTKDIGALQSALGPWSADPLEYWEVGRQRLIDSDDERCIQPV